MAGRKAPEDQRRHAILKAAFAIASRERLAGVTGRRVAEVAGVSTGLVFFYYKTRDALLQALLEWLLERTIVAGELPGVAFDGVSATERMLATLRRDIERLPRQRERVELFFDFWVLGTRDPAIRRTIRAALDRYRDAFLPMAEAIVRSDPERFAGVDASALATMAASFVEGCALRAVLEPEAFDVETHMATLTALVAPRGVAARL